MTGKRRDKGALELQVLAVLAAAARPLTAREVQDELGDDLAYTTVMTTLGRLYDKGALSREPAGRAYAYRVVGDQRTVDAARTARRMRQLLDAGGDHAVALQHFVSELSAEDERVLVDLLHGLDAAADEPGPRERQP
jgi:predicted transcriptional regulator